MVRVRRSDRRLPPWAVGDQVGRQSLRISVAKYLRHWLWSVNETANRNICGLVVTIVRAMPERI
jgi:hypothetical protein